MMSRYRLVLVSSFFILAGCSTLNSDTSKNKSNVVTHPSKYTSPLLKEATNWLGYPYKYGGASPSMGFDCSGLVYLSAKNAHIDYAPRTSRDQFEKGQPIAYEDIAPGDLVFFRIGTSYINHVGIYAGNNNFLHAPHTNGVVSYANMTSTYWKKSYVGAKRWRSNKYN